MNIRQPRTDPRGSRILPDPIAEQRPDNKALKAIREMEEAAERAERAT